MKRFSENGARPVSALGGLNTQPFGRLGALVFQPYNTDRLYWASLRAWTRIAGCAWACPTDTRWENVSPEKRFASPHDLSRAFGPQKAARGCLPVRPARAPAKPSRSTRQPARGRWLLLVLWPDGPCRFAAHARTKNCGFKPRAALVTEWPTANAQWPAGAAKTRKQIMR